MIRPDHKDLPLMDYTGSFTTTGQHLLFTMASQSPTVQARLERELYRTTADSDGSSLQYIIDDAFQQHLMDLGTIGLQFAIDLTDYTGNWVKLGQFLKLTAYLLPATLYPMLKTQSALREMVEHCLNGTLSASETLIHSYLSELGGLDGQLPIMSELSTIIDEVYVQVTQSDNFTDYLRNQLVLSAEENLHPTISDEQHAAYQTFLKETIGRLLEATSLFAPYPFHVEMEQLSQQIIADFLAPANTLRYCYLFLEDPDALPEELHQRFGAKQYHYQVAHPWCYDYYTVRKIAPSRMARTLICCFVYALQGKTPVAYDAALAAMQQEYPDPETNTIIRGLYSVTANQETL